MCANVVIIESYKNIIVARRIKCFRDNVIKCSPTPIWSTKNITDILARLLLKKSIVIATSSNWWRLIGTAWIAVTVDLGSHWAFEYTQWDWGWFGDWELYSLQMGGCSEWRWRESCVKSISEKSHYTANQLEDALVVIFHSAFPWIHSNWALCSE